MNRHTTPPQVTPPYTNGHYETPLEVSGVSLRPPAPTHQPTVFPPDLPVRGLGPWLYAIHRFQFVGLPLARYLIFVWLFLAGIAALNLLPGRWFIISLALLLTLGQLLLWRRYHQQQFVGFVPIAIPSLNRAPLQPHEKLPIYATGLLSVEGREQYFSALPGFYRTFATGEHAVLCRAAERGWLGVLGWPPEEVGMWYTFLNPSDIDTLMWGQLNFGTTQLPALAVVYRLELPAGPRRKNAEVRQVTLYLAARATDDAQQLYVDLLKGLPPEKIVTSLSTPT